MYVPRYDLGTRPHGTVGEGVETGPVPSGVTQVQVPSLPGTSFFNTVFISKILASLSYAVVVVL